MRLNVLWGLEMICIIKILMAKRILKIVTPQTATM
jgi:hypothetical protein